MSNTDQQTRTLNEEQLLALDEFEDDLYDAIEKLDAKNVPPYEVVFWATRLFSRLAFDLAPDIDVARKTIDVAIKEALYDHNRDLIEEEKEELGY